MTRLTRAIAVLVPVAAVVVAAVLSAEGAAGAAAPVDRPLATLAANVPIAAEGGWVAWSAPVRGGWGLEAWHAGKTVALPVAPRAQPFDLDLGTDARGRTVATFSRCATSQPVGAAGEDFFARTKPWTSAGCRVRVLDLASGRERAAGVPRRAGTSDTTPSMWRGSIAFARRDLRRHKDVAQLLLWSARTRRLTALPHGAMPTRCPYRTGCAGVTIRGAVQGVDLGSRLVSLLWWIDAPGVIGHGGWEVRADRLRDRRSVLLGSGFIGEACAGGRDLSVPSAPSSDGDDVWYSDLVSSCYHDSVSLVRIATAARRAASGPLAGEVVQTARDGNALYALVAPKPQADSHPRCNVPAAPCVLQRVPDPALAPAPFKPHSPIFS